MGESKSKKAFILIGALIVFCFISIYAVGNKACVIQEEATKKEQTQSLEQAEEIKNQNEALFVGCNGFF